MLKKVKFKIDQKTVEDSMFCGYEKNPSGLYSSNCLIAVLLNKRLNLNDVSVGMTTISFDDGSVTRQDENFNKLIKEFDRMNPTERYQNLIGREVEILLDDELLKNSDTDIDLEEWEEWEEDEEECEEEIIEELLH